MNRSYAIAVCCSLYALLCMSAVRSAEAQASPPPAADEGGVAAGPDGSTPDLSASAALPAASADLAAQITALRSEVDALKSKQEEAEAAALLSADPIETPVENETLRVYGFMDFGLDKFMGSVDNPVAVVKPTRATTFVFGNLNLYFDATPVEHLRCLAEVRLTLAPHGEETSVAQQYARIDTTAFDFASPSSQSQLRLGGLYIERAYSQYEFSKAFRLQWGLFLNPFGIWNLDHGSPTLISLILPTFISSQMVPTRLLGLHAFGSLFFGNSELGYALHVTNGRSPIDFDFTDDKAVGARLYWAYESDFGRLVLGASGYVGRYVDQQRSLKIMTGKFGLGENIVVDYMEEALGLDAALDIGSLRVRAESVLHWIDYADGKAERGLSAQGTLEFLPSRTEWSGYVLAAYRTPFRVEPYIQAESAINKAAILPRWAGASAYSTPNSASLTLSAGFNVELTTHTQFKTQLAWVRAYDRHFENKNVEVPMLFVRLVDSF